MSLALAGVTGRSSLLFFDAETARAQLLADPWIAEAAVLKLYPDRLLITITERQAFALWQRNGQVNVIADDGTVLQPFVEDRYRGLPLVVGSGAVEKHINSLFSKLGLSEEPDVHRRVKAVLLFLSEQPDDHP